MARFDPQTGERLDTKPAPAAEPAKAPDKPAQQAEQKPEAPAANSKPHHGHRR